MRFRTRAFLLCFVPFALLLTGSFWAIQKLVKSTVRDGLRTSLRENHLAVARLRARSDLRNSRFVKIVAENASLKAGLQLLVSYPDNSAARQTVEDQLRELCQQMEFDFLMVSDSNGTPLAGVLRGNAQVIPPQLIPPQLIPPQLIPPQLIPPQLIPMDAPLTRAPRQGLMMLADKVYQVASVPIDQGEENIGELSVGERFDFSGFSTPGVLMRHGKVVQSSVPEIGLKEVEASLRGCRGQGECDVRLGGAEYISLPMDSVSLGGLDDAGRQGDGYVLRSLQNVDSASAPVQSVLNRVFFMAATAMVFTALMFSVFSSRSMVEPITAMISHLQASEGTGLLPEFQGQLSSIREIRDLTSSFNHAAGAIREARQGLQRAYVESVGSLANALDARDRYTAGHSRRVSDLSCATAAALGATADELEAIRIGALLHDIGKIGISDTVLLKAGKLTHEEFAIIRQHPEIGRRILEGVQGFAPYLDVVELHHENWDGTGYPHGQSGETTPLAARIVHVSDAYDAMTTDRPYRRGMSHKKAISILREFAGRQFDPRVVDAFTSVADGPAALVEVSRQPELAEVGRR